MSEGPQHWQVTRRVGVAVGSSEIPALTAGLVLEPGGPAFTDKRRAGQEAGAPAVRPDLEIGGDDLVEQRRDGPHEWSDGTGDEDRAVPRGAVRANGSAGRSRQAAERGLGDVLVDDAQQFVVAGAFVAAVDRPQERTTVTSFGQQP